MKTLMLIAGIFSLNMNSALAIGKPHVVFVTGDEEYRSEESMPMLARILKRDFGFEISIAYSLDDKGFVDPNNTADVTGIEALKTADLLVLFTRFRHWPDKKFLLFLDYVADGKPIVGFRTATHAFRYPTEHKFEVWNEEKIADLMGQKWITHHGHHGTQILTTVRPLASAQEHSILRGVKPFDAYSWLYHVQGGEDKLHGDVVLLVEGTALKSKHLRTENTKKYPLTGPTAWVKTYTGVKGKRAVSSSAPLRTRSTLKWQQTANSHLTASFGQWEWRTRFPRTAAAPNWLASTTPTMLDLARYSSRA